jgi:hypothetical protein
LSSSHSCCSPRRVSSNGFTSKGDFPLSLFAPLLQHWESESV